MTIAEGNVAAAIGLVCVAGLSTTIGASAVFFPSLVKRASRRVLASSLGLSSGVMVYVSFVAISANSVDSFVNAGIEENRAYVYSTLSFFGGVLVMVILDLCIKRVTRDREPIRRDQDDDIDIEVTWNVNEEHCETDAEQQETYVPHYCMGCTDDPAGDLEEWHELAELELEGDRTVPTEISIGCRRESSTLNEEESGKSQEGNRRKPSEESNRRRPSDGGGESGDCPNREEEDPNDGPQVIRVIVENVSTPQEQEGDFRAPVRAKIHPKDEERKLVKASYSTALAIFLHNFPEGMATFVAALDNPRVGAVLATAIGIHNIPEGLCVALPIYYATGNRWKAFRWGIFAGISEPIAAILAWLVLARIITPEAYGIIFGLTSGMMVIISLKELIPTAFRYDPEDTVVSCSIIIGMGIMALSLMLFKV